MSNDHYAIQANSPKALNSASFLSYADRKQFAIEAGSGTATITKLDLETNTSRKFIYA